MSQCSPHFLTVASPFRSTTAGWHRAANYGGLFQAWELAIARKLVREFHATSRALQHEEADDLLQEVLLHWHHARASHDPLGKASIRTYMARVVRNKLIDLIRERESDKEKVNILAVPTGNHSRGRARQHYR
ncbi:MAG: hypothetical protein IPG28_20325 [Betaproteobacteria bacterium]|nr:hypothetical protein [Betaproteobacteria bacterium]